MHPNRKLLAHFVVHMPLCLHDLFRVVHPLHSNRAREPSLGVCSHRGARILLCAGNCYAMGGGDSDPPVNVCSDYRVCVCVCVCVCVWCML